LHQNQSKMDKTHVKVIRLDSEGNPLKKDGQVVVRAIEKRIWKELQTARVKHLRYVEDIPEPTLGDSLSPDITGGSELQCMKGKSVQTPQPTQPNEKTQSTLGVASNPTVGTPYKATAHTAQTQK